MRNWIVNHYRLLLLLFTGLAVAAPFSFHQLKTDTGFDKFFPKAAPELTFYEEFSRHLGNTEQLMLLSVEHEPDVFDAVFLSRMGRFMQSLNTFPEVQGVQSIFSFMRQRQTAIGLYQTPYLHINNPALYQQDSAYIFKDYHLTQYFISPDSRSLSIQIRLKPTITLSAVEHFISGADSLAAALALPPLHFMGQKFLESQFRLILQQETKKVFWLSIGFVLLVLFLIYRSWKGVFIPLVTVVISLLVFYAYMAVFKRPLTIMASLFPTLILIVGISDAIHICSLYIQKSRAGFSRKRAVSYTLQEIGFTNFLTSFTTALGLLSLLTSSMEALQQFGFDAAVGVMLVYGVSIILTPALLMWLGMAQGSDTSGRFSYIDRFLRWLTRYQADNKKTIIACSSVIMLLSCLALFNLNFNNYILSALPKDSRLHIDFTYIKLKQKGARTLEFALLAKAGHNFSEHHTARQIGDLHAYLETLPQLSNILSPVTQYRWASQLHFPGSDWKLPSAAQQFGFLNHSVYQLNRQSGFQLLDSTQTWGRLMAIVPDMGREGARQLQLNIQQWVTRNSDLAVWEIHPTGIHYLMDKGHEHRIMNLFTGLLLAMTAVALVVGSVFKKWGYVWVCLLTNLIPLVITFGIMGLTGMEMRGATSIIFAVGYVIAVDDTLHFLNRFRLEYRKGKETGPAIRDTLLYTGKAITHTSLILMGGFAILLISDFGDIFMFGLLTSIMLLTACLTNLFLAPTLTHFFIKK